MAKKKDKKTAIKQNDYILLDRSGSMSEKWNETITSINAYVHELARKGVDTLVTLAVFDDHAGFQYDVVRAAMAPDDWKDITVHECQPRGWTPLYDAVGRIASQAISDAPEKAAIIIMTDGDENCSTEYTQQTAKALLEDCKKKGWSVVFLGADFKNQTQAINLGATRGATMAMKQGSYSDAMVRMAFNRTQYASGAAATMDWSDEDRRIANEDEVR